MSREYQVEFDVVPETVDANRHMNNVAYVQWMQTAAMRHAAASGCTAETERLGASWVVRAHRIEYLAPAFAGDRIRVSTWVEDFRKVRSLRRYEFVRAGDGIVIAQGETDWVFVDAATGRPRRIPDTIRASFDR
jgi:acyl-CoA thioester hydrolase